MNNKPTYSNKVIEIADFIFKYPDKKMSDVLSYFVGKYRKNIRTIERYTKQAKEYNKLRIQTQEKAKADILVKSAKESLKRAILSRDESLEILTTIAKGSARKVGEKILMPSDSERTKAISTIAELQGWMAPVKNAQTDSWGNDIPQTIKVTLNL